MSPEEIGLLVLRIQDDDVLPSDMRKFLSALMQDEEIRRNARLVAALSGLPEEIRQKHCLAHVLTLLTASQLAPTELPKRSWTRTTKRFGEKFFVCLSGPWKAHLYVDGMGAAPGPRLVQKLRGRRREGLPEFQVSSELGQYIAAIEDFWGVRGYLVS